MLSTATCAACQFPLSPEDEYCPRCGRPVSLLGAAAGADADRRPERRPDDAASPGADGAGASPTARAGQDAPLAAEPASDQRNGDAGPAGRLQASPGFGLPTPITFRAAPAAPVSEPQRRDEPAHVAKADDDEAATAANMPPAPHDGADAAPSPFTTASLPVRPAGSHEPPRFGDAQPRPWEANHQPMAIPEAAPSAPAVTSPPGIYAAAPDAPAPPGSAPVATPTAAEAADAAKNTAGALVLLPGEELIMQLGALYLTNRRAILYAPTILRSAFLRDVDAIGTLTERSSGWLFFLSLVMLSLAGGGIYLLILGREVNFLGLTSGSLLLVVIPLAILGLIMLITYFFWIKRSLFLSVGGRPLIVVSISAWNQRKLESVDGFVNAFSQAKDAIEREARESDRL